MTAPSARRSSRLKFTSSKVSSCNLFFYSFCCNEQSHLALCLSIIDHGNNSLFRGVFYIYHRVPLNQLCLLVEYRVVSQPSTRRLKISIKLYFIRPEGEAPERKVNHLYNLSSLTQGTRPMASCSEFRGSTRSYCHR
jgi:hypothetical protein